MSARLTRAELAQQLEAAHIAYQRLAAETEALRAEVARTMKPARYSPQRYPAATEAHNAYVSALNAAKALAIKTGRCVSVGSGR